MIDYLPLPKENEINESIKRRLGNEHKFIPAMDGTAEDGREKQNHSTNNSPVRVQMGSNAPNESSKLAHIVLVSLLSGCAKTATFNT